MKEKATYGNQHTGKMRWGRDGTRVRADAYEDLFWLEPGDAAIFAAPDSESSCELGESIKAFDKILPTP